MIIAACRPVTAECLQMYLLTVERKRLHDKVSRRERGGLQQTNQRKVIRVKGLVSSDWVRSHSQRSVSGLN